MKKKETTNFNMKISFSKIDNEHPVRFAVVLNQTIVEELSKLYNNTLEKPFIILHRLDSTPQVRKKLVFFSLEFIFVHKIGISKYNK